MSNPSPGHCVWHRPSRRSRWQLVTTAPTRDAALEKVKGAGDWYVGTEGVDPNKRARKTPPAGPKGTL